MPVGADPGSPLAICLGKLSAAASVELNGVKLRDVWHDDTVIKVDNLKPSGNILKVEVGTTLRNRMTGDMTLYGRPRTIPTPYSVENFRSGDEWLTLSGWVGPLSIVEYDR